MKQENIRNFSIIAHIDHGKSTLADRLIEETGSLEKRLMKKQVLDNMEIEKERGITVKSQAARMEYVKDGEKYILNLIDTPGHVDFNYEVSRSLAACEGAILVVDATQGIEAQTLANLYLALDSDLEILPVINKIDLPNARTEEVRKEVSELIGVKEEDIPCVSAKTGENISMVLEKIIEIIPSPEGDVNKPLKALVFDSKYDNYLGVIAHIRVFDGFINKNDNIHFIQGGENFELTEIGTFRAGELNPGETLKAGEVGYIAASIKDAKHVRVGDTVTKEGQKVTPLPGYKKSISMVYCGMYPLDGEDYDALKEAAEKLKLNDAAFEFEPETSKALGFGFRCGFLGLLHLEITVERIEREFKIPIITTAPSVIYKVYEKNGKILNLYNPADLPDPVLIEKIEEPIMKVEIIIPTEYIGNVMKVCQDRRGTYISLNYLDEKRVSVEYEMPLNEIVYDFFDYIKSQTRGYASVSYTFLKYKESDLVKLDIHINGEVVDALSFIVHKDSSYTRGRKIAEKLKEEIPRQLFEVPIQAVIGGKIIARETVKAVRKDVLAKCYGGDITRKKKLLEKQKKGKKRMKQVGNVEVPQEAFLSVLKFGED